MEMRQHIRMCKQDGGLRKGLPRAQFRFPPEFAGFRGHFPGRPIVPGVCMLQAAAVTLEDWQQRVVRVREILKARFLAPLQPGDGLDIECLEWTGGPDAFTARLTLCRQGSNKASECTLRGSLAGPLNP